MSFCSCRQRGDVTKPQRIKTQRAAIKQLKRSSASVWPSLIRDSSQNTQNYLEWHNKTNESVFELPVKVFIHWSMKRRIIHSAESVTWRLLISGRSYTLTWNIDKVKSNDKHQQQQQFACVWRKWNAAHGSVVPGPVCRTITCRTIISTVTQRWRLASAAKVHLVTGSWLVLGWFWCWVKVSSACEPFSELAFCSAGIRESHLVVAAYVSSFQHC